MLRMRNCRQRPPSADKARTVNKTLEPEPGESVGTEEASGAPRHGTRLPRVGALAARGADVRTKPLPPGDDEPSAGA